MSNDVIAPFRHRTPPPSYQPGWILQEFTNVEQRIPNVSGFLGPVVVPTDSRWGASGTANDTAAWQRALSSLANRGGLFYIPNNPVPGTPWRVENLVPPAGVSITAMGESGSNCLVAPPTADPTASVYDLTGCNGPALRFTNHKLIGAINGSQDSRLVKMNTTNGARFDHMWLGGGLYGADLQAPCTDNHFYACVFESNGQSLNIHSDATGIVVRGCIFVDNNQDIQILGAGAVDCSTFVFAHNVSIRAKVVAFLAQQCTDLVVDDFRSDGGVVGLQLNNCQDATLRAVRMIRSSSADYANSGTFRVFATDCTGDLSPFYGTAGLYLGQKSGNNRVVYTRGVPTSLSWNTGDVAVEVSPAVGSPKGWRRLTTGAANVLGVDWVSEGNL